MQTAKKQFIGTGRFDPINSTYKHVITMKTEKGPHPITGYSKGLLYREMSDKIVLLESVIGRLVKNGYLFGVHQKYGHPTIKWEFFINGTYEGVPDELIFTLYPDEYIFEKNQDFTTNLRLNTFFSRIYTQAKNGKLETKSLRHIPTDYTVKETFDISKKRFSDEPELYKWMQLKIREGYARGEVFDFYVKYCSKWFKK